jgi:hypothetical protein
MKKSSVIFGKGDHFRFGSVFIKKSNQTEIFFLKKKPKPNRNRVKPIGFGLVFLGQKPFKPVWLGFSGFGSVFSVLARFFPVLARFFSVWLGFFGLARFFRFGSVFFWFFVGFDSVRFFRL